MWWYRRSQRTILKKILGIENLKLAGNSRFHWDFLSVFEVTVTDDNIKKRFAIKTSRSRLQWRFHHTNPPLARLYSTIGKQYFNLLIVYRRALRALRNYHHLLCFRIRLGGGNGRKARREEASEKKSGRDSLISLLQRSNKTRVFIHFSVSPAWLLRCVLMMCALL